MTVTIEYMDIVWFLLLLFSFFVGLGFSLYQAFQNFTWLGGDGWYTPRGSKKAIVFWLVMAAIFIVLGLFSWTKLISV